MTPLEKILWAPLSTERSDVAACVTSSDTKQRCARMARFLCDIRVTLYSVDSALKAGTALLVG